MPKNHHSKKLKQQPLCLQSTVEQIARKLHINGSVLLSTVEDQFRLLGTRIAVGGLGFDSAERRAAVLLQQCYNIPWKSVADTIGVKTTDIKKLELLQHALRNHLQPRQPGITIQNTSCAGIGSRVTPATTTCGVNCKDDTTGTKPRQLRTRPYQVEYKNSTLLVPSTYTPQILPALVLRLSGYLDDPHGTQAQGTKLLQYMYETTPVSTDQKRAHLYELQRYAAAYEVATLIAIAHVPVDAAVMAAAKHATRMEIQQVLPRVKEALLESKRLVENIPWMKPSPPVACTAGKRMAAAALTKTNQRSECDMMKETTVSTKRAKHSGCQDGSDTASTLAQAIVELADPNRPERGTEDDDSDLDMDEWRHRVLADSVRDHSSIELAARKVLEKFDLSTAFVTPT